MAEPAARYERSAGGMVGALLVLVAVVAAFVLFREANRTDPVSSVRPVDYLPVAERARAEGSLDIVAPPSLPPGWVATSADWVGGPDQSWHLGVVTDRRRYIGLEQADRSVAEMVEAHVDPDATEGTAVAVDGRDWRTFTDDGGDRALVRREAETTTLLVGRVSSQSLVEYLALLEESPQGARGDRLGGQDR